MVFALKTVYLRAFIFHMLISLGENPISDVFTFTRSTVKVTYIMYRTAIKDMHVYMLYSAVGHNRFNNIILMPRLIIYFLNRCDQLNMVEFFSTN